MGPICGVLYTGSCAFSVPLLVVWRESYRVFYKHRKNAAIQQACCFWHLTCLVGNVRDLEDPFTNFFKNLAKTDQNRNYGLSVKLESLSESCNLGCRLCTFASMVHGRGASPPSPPVLRSLARSANACGPCRRCRARGRRRCAAAAAAAAAGEMGERGGGAGRPAARGARGLGGADAATGGEGGGKGARACCRGGGLGVAARVVASTDEAARTAAGPSPTDNASATTCQDAVLLCNVIEKCIHEIGEVTRIKLWENVHGGACNGWKGSVQMRQCCLS